MKHSQRICIYSPWMMPLGGIETHLVNMASCLAAEGWRVNFCVKYSAITKKTAEHLANAGVLYHRFPSPGFFYHTLFSDALLYTNSQGNTSPMIWRYGKSVRKGFHHCHTTCSARERELWPPRYVDFIKKGPPLVACSQSTADNLRELNPDRRIHVLPYFAVGDGLATFSATHAGRTPVGKGGPLHFGFIGRVEPSKGIDLIIEASRHPDLADIQWHIFGDGAQAGAVRAASGPNLVWHGAFDRSVNLLDIYGPMDAVVLPSSHVEGSPLCLIEALAFGKPWIAFDQGGIRELAASDADCLVLDPDHREGFHEAVTRLRARLVSGQVDVGRLRSHYQQGFSPSAVYVQWKAFLESFYH